MVVCEFVIAINNCMGEVCFVFSAAAATTAF